MKIAIIETKSSFSGSSLSTQSTRQVVKHALIRVFRILCMVKGINSYCCEIWEIFMEKLTLDLILEGWTGLWVELKQRGTFLLKGLELIKLWD